MKRILCFLLCVCLFLSLLAGCKNDNGAYIPTGDALTGEDGVTPQAPQATDTSQELSLTFYPKESLNPYICQDFTNRALFGLLYQGLFALDRNYNLEPMLCKEYSCSQDMKTYVFYMEKATFPDGSVISDTDVAASLLAAKDNPVYSSRFAHVEEISVLPEGGVQITLSTPMEQLPLLLDIPILRADQVAADRPVGTGPYYLDETGTAPVLRRRENWWCSAQMPVTANAIALKTATSNSQIRDLFEFENLSLVCADPGSDKYADFRCDYELWDCENSIFLYLACNLNSEVFADPTVRSTLPGTVDRDSIVDSFYRGFARSTTLPAVPQSQYYNAALAAKYGYDSGNALKTAVANAEMTGKSIVFLTNSDDTLRLRVAKSIISTFTDAGLSVTLSALPTDQYITALENGDYDLYLGQTKLSPNMDLSAFFSTMGAMNYGSFADPNLYAMSLEALANYGNFYTLYQSLMNDGRLVPILVRSYALYANRGAFTTLTPARDNIFYYSLGKSMEKAKIQ